MDAFYGKSWLLYHYLTFTPSRAGQLQAYMKAMAAGKTSREAAEASFGDLDQLQKDIARYLKQKPYPAFPSHRSSLRCEGKAGYGFCLR